MHFCLVSYYGTIETCTDDYEIIHKTYYIGGTFYLHVSSVKAPLMSSRYSSKGFALSVKMR